MHNIGDFDRARDEASAAAAAARQAGATRLAAIAAFRQAETDLFAGVPLAASPGWHEALTHQWDSPPIYEHTDRIQAWDLSWSDRDLGSAAGLLQGLASKARRVGDLASEGQIALHQTEIEIRRGRFDAADTFADVCYRLEGNGAAEHIPLYLKAHVAAWRGELKQARRLATAGVRMARDFEDWIFAAQNLFVLGFTEVSAGDYGVAAEYETALRDLLRRMHWNHPGPYRWQADAVEAFLAVGRAGDAADVAAELWSQADELNLAGSRSVAARCDGLIHATAGELKRAHASLAQSMQLMDGLEMPLERARTLLALGVVQRRVRRKAAARAALAEAFGIFAHAGAQVWARRTKDELDRAAGTPGGRILTTREQAVAQLAAAGATNNEIGTRLFLSPKTVEAVLTKVYRKLGLRSRTELARHLQRNQHGA